MRIISRAGWGARRPKDRTFQDPRSVREIFIHYSESPGGQVDFQAQKRAIKTIQDFHMDTRGWSDIAYSYLIVNSTRPRVFCGRGARAVPAAQLGHNTGTIAVCVVMTDNQKLTWQTRLQLRRLIWNLRRKTIRREVPVRPHSAVTDTSCPGDQLREFIARRY